jgi:gliding motility-associated-like protein
VRIDDPIATPDETTVYVVEVTDHNSCQNLDSVMITVVDADIWAPTAFTPDGDGANDVFYIRNNGAEQFQFMVYNRNGELIFTTNNPDNGWDGTRQGTGEEMPSGAYVYSAKGELSDGNPFGQSGMVNLIR